MKILYPTDFSNASANAFIYALKLAEKLNATITVIHVYEALQMHSWIEESMNMREVNDKITLGEFERFKEELEVLKRISVENQLGNIEVKYALRESDYVVDAIISEAEDIHADLLVVGTTGATGLKELFFGSVASKVMERATCPVFVIPDTATYRGIQKLGLTLEYKEGELALIERALSITRKLKGQLHCIHVDVFDPDTQKTKVLAYKEAFKNETDISFHTHYEMDVEKGILEFMKFNLIDIVVMLVHQQSMLKDLFSYSIAKRVAYHTDIPLLALQVAIK